jgi:hypothetical protein
MLHLVGVLKQLVMALAIRHENPQHPRVTAVSETSYPTRFLATVTRIASSTITKATERLNLNPFLYKIL